MTAAGGRSRWNTSCPPLRNHIPPSILLHGSDGVASSGKRFRLIMQGLAALGYAAVLPHYFDRTGDEDIGVGEQRAQSVGASFPHWQEAVTDAVGAAARLPGVDPARIALVGFSLGSFLALGAAANNSRVRCVIEFCGGLPEHLRGQVETMPPVLILHGEADRTVPVARALELQQELTAKGSAPRDAPVPRPGPLPFGRGRSRRPPALPRLPRQPSCWNRDNLARCLATPCRRGRSSAFPARTCSASAAMPSASCADSSHDYGDIAFFQISGPPTVLLSHPDHIRDVLVTHARGFAKGRGLERSKRLLGEGLLTSEGDFHLRQRRLIQPAFHRRRIETYGQVMADCAAQMRDRWQDGQTGGHERGDDAPDPRHRRQDPL